MICLFQVAIMVVPEGQALCEFGHRVLGNEGMDITATLSVFALSPAAAPIVLVSDLHLLGQFGKLLFHDTGN